MLASLVEELPMVIWPLVIYGSWFRVKGLWFFDERSDKVDDKVNGSNLTLTVSATIRQAKDVVTTGKTTEKVDEFNLNDKEPARSWQGVRRGLQYSKGYRRFLR